MHGSFKAQGRLPTRGGALCVGWFWWGRAALVGAAEVVVLGVGLSVAVFGGQLAQRERCGALYCAVLFALRRFVARRGMFLVRVLSLPSR